MIIISICKTFNDDYTLLTRKDFNIIKTSSNCTIENLWLINIRDSIIHGCILIDVYLKLALDSKKKIILALINEYYEI